MSYKAILFNTATYRGVHNSKRYTDDNKKCYEMKINNGKTEEYCDCASLQSETVCNGHLSCQIDGEGGN